jgi:uncharacterized protein (TIGR03435 family)
MRILPLSIAALVFSANVLSVSALHAQDLTGTWQGTIIATPNNVRTIINFKKSDKGEMTGLMYRPDEATWQPVPVSAIKVQGGTVTFALSLMEVTYEGKVGADGKFITGTWAHGPTTHPLDLVLVTDEAAKWPLPAPPERPKPMPADASPAFDVVTIKPSEPGSPGKGIGFQGRHFHLVNMDVNDLLGFAYSLHPAQIIGAPAWFATDLYVIDGVPDVEGQPSQKQANKMLAKLLADRFQLKFHHEQKELPVYVITLTKGGPKMTKDAGAPGDNFAFFFRSLGDLTARNITMPDFATWFQGSVTDKPVVDHTGLTDRYDFTLKWTPDDSQFVQFRGSNPLPPPREDAPPSLYTAAQEQLGLKFEATKALDDVMVIDHVEKPSPN